jgi:anti-sigma B factor antagonist
MSGSKLTITEREAGDVTILTLTGPILIDDGDLEIKKRVHELLGRDRLKFLICLSGVTHMDSAGVGMLAAKAKTVRDRGGDLKLLSPTPREQRLFHTMKLHLMFEIFDDEPQALESFARPHVRQ